MQFKGSNTIASLSLILLYAGGIFAEGTEYTWYDGDTPRKVHMQANHVAEFVQSDAQSSVRSVDSQAKLVESRGGVRIWTLRQVDAGTFMASMQAKGGTYSPVFTATKNGGMKRALPGGVIVYLHPDWTEARAHAWARKNGLAIRKKLNLKTNVYLLATPSGIVSLESANALRRQEGVLAAMPNWWVEFRTR